MNDLHEYLRVNSGDTAERMLANLHRNKASWAGVPETREAFDAGLSELLAAGLAAKTGEFWHWVPKPRVAVVEPQRELFA